MKKEEEKNDYLSQEQGQKLVRLARRTIEKKLGQAPAQEELQSSEQTLDEDIFKVHCGNFVTLKMDTALRGCIGSLEGHVPLAQGVSENAINAAFKDPRFPPMTKEELQRVNIEVSILTEPKPFDYSDSEDLIAKLRPHVDGVIIRKGYATATFLPQVWEQLPNPKSFLNHLCLKAGLGADAWRKEKLTVFTYQVQYFEEK